jgi:predicted DNA-binding transcriptional regulator YafY
MLSFGEHIEVVEPQALREKVIAAARSILALYAQSAAAPTFIRR